MKLIKGFLFNLLLPLDEFVHLVGWVPEKVQVVVCDAFDWTCDW